MDELEEDKLTVARAEKCRFYPNHSLCEVFTGSRKLVDLTIIKGFDAICKGEYDNLPEAAFYMVGGIEEVLKKQKS